MGKIFAALFVFAALPLRAQESPRPEVIYGDDDRLDLYQVENPKLRELADSTVALFEASDVAIDGGKAKLTLTDYGQQYNLCPEEPFREQKNGAFCSGSLVAADILMTAGHCVRSEGACQGTKFVFGFAITEKGKQGDTVPASEVYSCKQLLGRVEQGSGPDWALVRLDRKVSGHKPLRLSSSVPPKGAPLFVIGHPAGLPTKVAGGASVRDPSLSGYFKANLDTYGGNSGSAVFNAATGLVEGILVRGEQDYEWKGACRVSKVCASDGCSGEDVTKVGEVKFPAEAPMRLVSSEELANALERVRVEIGDEL